MEFPTKAELLHHKLVSIDPFNKKVVTNTLQVASYFGKRPSDVNRRIALLVSRGLCRIAPSYYLNQQFKQQKYYELNREQFLLVVMGFTGDKADQFKADFIQLFNEQEAELLQWRKQSLLTSECTKEANEQIQWLQVQLLNAFPESKKGRLIFIHIQQAITKAVSGVASTKREAMSTYQLSQIEQLERNVNSEIALLRLENHCPLEIREHVLKMIKEYDHLKSIRV